MAKAELKEVTDEPQTEAPSDVANISAKLSDGDRTVSTDYKVGANLKEMTDLFGEESVYSNARGAIVIAAQGIMRRLIKAGKSDEEITAHLADWKPGVKGPVTRKSAKEKAESYLSGLSPEEREALFQKYS